MAVVEERNSFVLYGSYKEQFDMLTNEQAGQWIQAVFTYVCTGEKHCDDPMVAMMLSMTCHQLDIDARKYAERLERQKEAARKAGRASAEKRAQKKAAEEIQRNATVVNDCQRFQHEDEDVDEYENEYEDEYENDIDDDDDLNNNGRRHRQKVAGDTAILFFGTEHWPVMPSSLQIYKALANRLTQRYMNRPAGDFDIQKVMEYASRVEYTAADQSHMVCDEAKTELLEFVFERAAEQEHVTWKYIDGIIINYRNRGVYTVNDAIENEYSWNRGEILY